MYLNNVSLRAVLWHSDSHSGKQLISMQDVYRIFFPARSCDICDKYDGGSLTYFSQLFHNFCIVINVHVGVGSMHRPGTIFIPSYKE